MAANPKSIQIINLQKFVDQLIPVRKKGNTKIMAYNGSKNHPNHLNSWKFSVYKTNKKIL